MSDPGTTVRQLPITGPEDRSHRVREHPWRVSAEVEEAVCEMRRTHPKWGLVRSGRLRDRTTVRWSVDVEVSRSSSNTHQVPERLLVQPRALRCRAVPAESGRHRSSGSIWGE